MEIEKIREVMEMITGGEICWEEGYVDFGLHSKDEIPKWKYEVLFAVKIGIKYIYSG